jgi:hypothetical protein
MENILLITNYNLNNIIDSINKQKDIDHLNKADTDVDDKISGEILTSLNTIFDSIVPIIDFFTNPDLTELFFDQDVAITELLQIHYEYIESTKDNADFNEELLEDYLINFYSYKTSPFSKYLTCSETIRRELTKLKYEFSNTRGEYTSDEESIVREAKSRGELVGGGFVDKAAILSSIVLLLGSSFIGITQASQENKQVAIQQILPSNVNDTRYATALYEERVNVIKDIYTSDITASLGAVVVSADVIGSLSKWFYGDDNVKAWEELLNTISGVNTANDEICRTAVQSLSEYFQTFEEAFDASAYDITEDKTFDEVLAAAEEAVDEADISVETSGLLSTYNRDFSIGPPVDKEMKHIKTGFKEFTTSVKGEVLTESQAAQFNSDLHDAVSDIIINKRKKKAQTTAEMRLFEKSKLFELGRLCNANLFSGIWGEEALIRIDLYSNAFRTATYENILENFARNPSTDETKLSQYSKLQHVLKVLSPLDLMGKLTSILEKEHLSTPVVIQEVNDMLSKYKADLEIIRRYDDPSRVFEDIKNRKDHQDQEELRKIQAEFDMELTKNATKLANEEAATSIDSRLSLANNTLGTLGALATLWTSWTSGVTGVILDPVAGVVDKTVETVADLAVGQTYTLFFGFMKIAGMATITLAAGISVLTCFKSSGAISTGLSSMVPHATEAAGDMVHRASEATSVAASNAVGNAASAVGNAANNAAVRILSTGTPSRWDRVGNAANNAAVRILSTGTPSRWDRGGSSRQTRKKRRTKKNKRTRKNRRTRKNKRAKKNKSRKK